MNLITAVKNNDEKTVKLLASSGYPINETDAHGGTALMWAALKGLLPICKILITAGANVNIIDNDGDTALNMASAKGQTDIVKLLLKHGADGTLTNQQGQTALTIAVQNNQLALLKILKPSKKSFSLPTSDLPLANILAILFVVLMLIAGMTFGILQQKLIKRQLSKIETRTAYFIKHSRKILIEKTKKIRFFRK